jgi:hypothetical protein
MARTVLLSEDSTLIIEFDAVEIESPQHDISITSYPVELGANLVDHIRLQPISMRLTAVVSNFPTRGDIQNQLDGETASMGIDIRKAEQYLSGTDQGEALARQGFRPAIPETFAGIPLTQIVTVRAAVRVWGDGKTPLRRVQNVLQDILQAQEDARQFAVVTDVLAGVYRHMVIKGLRFTRDVQWSQALKLELDLIQVFTAELLQRDVSHLAPKHPRTKPPAATQEPTAPVDAVTEQKAEYVGESWVSRWLL